MIPNPEAESRDEGSNNQVYDSERLVSIEINSDSFTSRVLNSTQNVVLLYTTGMLA